MVASKKSSDRPQFLDENSAIETSEMTRIAEDSLMTLISKVLGEVSQRVKKISFKRSLSNGKILGEISRQMPKTNVKEGSSIVDHLHMRANLEDVIDYYLKDRLDNSIYITIHGYIDAHLICDIRAPSRVRPHKSLSMRWAALDSSCDVCFLEV
jgi:hypothetical protein